MPEFVPECLSNTMPDKTPECMPDRMPEYMAGRMPECMLDRLPDRMPSFVLVYLQDRRFLGDVEAVWPSVISRV